MKYEKSMKYWKSRIGYGVLVTGCLMWVGSIIFNYVAPIGNTAINLPMIGFTLFLIGFVIIILNS